MVKRLRRHSAAYKFRIALEGSKTITQLSSENEVHANMMGAMQLNVPSHFH